MTAKSVREAGENPLVPNAKLRQMYIRMLTARMLDEAVTKRGKTSGRRIPTIHGQEAVRASTTIELANDDLVSDTAITAGMGLLMGGNAAFLLRGLTRTKKGSNKVWATSDVRHVLNAAGDTEERLRLSLGAALALKMQRRSGLVTAYAYKDDMRPATWRSILEIAARLELPILFIALLRNPSKEKDAETAKLCTAARAVGVPAIPVDACDAIALYRVTQESFGRLRGGDGPVLVEIVHWRDKGRRSGIGDPLEHLKESLSVRGICDAAWFKEIHKVARRQLFARSDSSKR
ncbi:thiamine pyrophosphate-dependent enzyme [Edaphobacter albus]|uniref:thiamine pyrophosphate-dependent enzyme n=1 Tax=Edaphobacter sp. 4G125 TaxID=2763071 RepID=UPI0016475823|nr:thiamine pyrophosphate-dependent enzyme [Edaphobacter sp. 4G125]QNI35521.1 hypothetical protein H7846_10595 [Edaphobacter sp. 4G125]